MRIPYLVIYIFLCHLPNLVFSQNLHQECDFAENVSKIKGDLFKSADHTLANELSLLYKRQLEYDSATVYYNRALQLAPNDSIKHYYTILETDIIRETASFDSIANIIASHYDSLHPFAAVILMKQASKLIYQGKYKSALPILNKSISVLSKYRETFDKEYLNAELGRMASLANTNQVDSAIVLGSQLESYMVVQYPACDLTHIRLLISMASRYDENEQIDSVDIYLQKAQGILDEYYLGNDPLYKLLYNELAELYNAKGKSNLALETYLKVERIALLNKEYNRKLLAKTYSSMASVYRSLLNSQKALQYYNRSIQMLEEEYGDNAPLLFSPYVNMGISLSSMKEYQEASYYLDQALEYALELVGENHIYTAIVTGSIASNASDSGDYQKAESYFRRSLAIREELFGPGSLRHANIYVNLSVMYRDMELFSKAEKYLQNALEIYVKEHGEIHPEVSGIHNRMGILLTLQNQNDAAVLAFHKGMKAGKMDDPDSGIYEILTHVTLLKNRAKAYLNNYNESREIDDLDLAKKDVVEGNALLVKSLESTIYTDATDEVTGRYRDLFDIGIAVNHELYLQSGNLALINEAWDLNDRTKSTSIRESLADINSLQYYGLDEELLAELSQTNQNLLSLVAQRKKDINIGIINSSADSSVVLQERLDSLEELLKESSPDFYQLQHSKLLVSISEIQQGLRSDEVILDYFLTDESLYVFSLTDSEQGFKSYPCSTELRDSLSEFVTDASDYNKEYGERINNWLYKTVLDQISPAIKYVKIIPDGSLTYLPFEMLQDESGRFLIEDYIVSYAHSLSILNHQNQKLVENGRFNFAGFAPLYQESVLDTNAQPQYALLVRSGNLPLPSAQKEVSKIEQLIGGESYKGSQATKANFIRMLDQTKVAHLSMHTLIDGANPLNSRFLFNNENGEIEDLYLFELYNLKSVVQLAVLSACETSVGRPDFSGSPNSLSNALAHSGIPATITSLWKVPDESTSDLMVSFYKYLKAGHRKDESLQMAKLDYLRNVKSPLQRSPLYWAGFVAVGNMDAISFNHTFQWWWLATFFIFMSILLFLIKKYRSR